MAKPELRLVVNLESLPTRLEELTRRKNWVLWRFEEVRGRNTKIPYQVSGTKASSTDPATWVTYSEAMKSRVGFDGIGFVMDAGLAAFDIDNCRDPETGAIHPWALEKVMKANSYAEVTISGTGLRIIGTCDPSLDIHRKQRVDDVVSCETYAGMTGRYIVMTGHAINEMGLHSIGSECRATVDELAKRARRTFKTVNRSSDSPEEKTQASLKEAVAIPPSVATLLSLPNLGSGKTHGAYPTRSELTFAFIVGCLRFSVSDDDIVAACLDPSKRGCAVFEHCTENRGRDYVVTQIAKAKEKSGTERDEKNSSILDDMNQKYALVKVGMKVAVMEVEDSAYGSVNLMHVSTFTVMCRNKPKVVVGKKKKLISDFWIESPTRREYRGIEFNPADTRKGFYNLWKGWAVAPRQGSCQLFLDHMLHNVAQDNATTFNWIMAWFAQLFQHPEKKIGTSLVLRGKQGVGKTIVGRVMGTLIGPHYLLVSEPRYITGQFNSHMASLLMLHADEAFWAGDKRGEGRLKDIITGDTQPIEFKGLDPIQVKNFIRLFVTGNHDWLVPAGMMERRFAVFDVGDAQIQNSDYFGAIEKEMNEGGREALLYWLLHFDLTQVNLRRVPKTAALLEQQIESSSPLEGWWFDTLRRGYLPMGHGEKNTCPVMALFARYVKHSSVQGARRRSIEVGVGMFMAKYVKGMIRRRLTIDRVDRQGHKLSDSQDWCYVLPSLKECRQQFSTMVQQDVQWEDDRTDWDKDLMEPVEDHIPF